MKKLSVVFLCLLICLFSTACSSQKLEEGWFGEGTYEVGEDIKEGVYYFKTLPDYALATYKIYRSMDVKKLEDPEEDGFTFIDDWEFFGVKTGQKLVIEHGMFTPESNIPPIDVDGEGIYRVGTDIPSGAYTLRKKAEDEEGYYGIYTISAEKGQDIVENGFFEDEITVEVYRGEYLEVSFAEIVE